MSQPNPPVAFSIAELIYQNVVDVLSRISTHAGYLNDLIVEEQRQGGTGPLRDGLVVVACGDPVPQPDAPLMHDEFLLPVGLCAHVIEPEASDPRVLRGRLGSVAADIRRALTEDLHRGGYAVNTEFPDKDEFNLAGAPPTVIVWPHVRFRTLYNDPYRQ
jgi:hypothetical protein